MTTLQMAAPMATERTVAATLFGLLAILNTLARVVLANLCPPLILCNGALRRRRRRNGDRRNHARR
eukprot:1946566-Lingulodinium_polyedra.AAC.1